MKQAVQIIFHLSETDGTEIYFETKGILDQQEQKTRLLFKEELEGNTPTIIEMDHHIPRVILKRLGEIRTHIEYQVGSVTQAIMKTDFNYELEMSTYTTTLEIDSRSLRIVYQTENDKEENRQHELYIKWQYEKN
ncbi:MAG: DUF1934 family protein [Prevotella sp.]|nr:DUF1934 family protein [Staphylococcus sp.]MCM1350905.1 DUF1934 family protein [Prevotella sp.]